MTAAMDASLNGKMKSGNYRNPAPGRLTPVKGVGLSGLLADASRFGARAGKARELGKR
jgi:hypothetical protein